MSRTRQLLTLASCLALASSACKDPSTTAPIEGALLLGTAADFLVLGASTVTSTGPTLIAGDLGLSPGTSVTGFPPGLVGGSTHVADAAAMQAQVDLMTAWTTLDDTPCGVTLDNAELGGLTLTPGVYCFTSSSVGLTGQLTLDAEGHADAVFAFQIASTLITASSSSVIVTNGGSDCNVFWQVGSSATLGTDTSFVGTILALVSITATTDATVSGRLLAHTGAVTLDSNTVTLACNVGGDVDAGIPDIDAGTPIDAGIPDLDSGTPIDAGVPDLDSGTPIDAGIPDLDAGTPIDGTPVPPAVCGNGVVDIGEQCDDGNTDNFDACSNQCTVTT